MKKEITYKNSFMDADHGPSTLPEKCRDCYGFSNWIGNRETTIYENRDCANCNIRTMESITI